ncbi:unnamed protein product [Diabrotica balteata]|uniref:Uncharacterized protein n=1 Tax=Diabrotica balteata TaxID=107213 RepID=A0A9P0DYI5_DIABA|nr:unnamed protein product [Diabrotica balteata]
MASNEEGGNDDENKDYLEKQSSCESVLESSKCPKCISSQNKCSCSVTSQNFEDDNLNSLNTVDNVQLTNSLTTNSCDNNSADKETIKEFVPKNFVSSTVADPENNVSDNQEVVLTDDVKLNSQDDRLFNTSEIKQEDEQPKAEPEPPEPSDTDNNKNRYNLSKEDLNEATDMNRSIYDPNPIPTYENLKFHSLKIDCDTMKSEFKPISNSQDNIHLITKSLSIPRKPLKLMKLCSSFVNTLDSNLLKGKTRCKLSDIDTEADLGVNPTMHYPNPIPEIPQETELGVNPTMHYPNPLPETPKEAVLSVNPTMHYPNPIPETPQDAELGVNPTMHYPNPIPEIPQETELGVNPTMHYPNPIPEIPQEDRIRCKSNNALSKSHT